jgi:hypothetical protein
VIGGALAAYFATSSGGTKRPVPWQDVTSEVAPAQWARPTTSVAHDQAKLDSLFATRTLAPHPTPPQIDFGRRELVLIAAGPRSSTGYSLHVESVTEQGGSIDVVVRERTPALGEQVTARLTYPLALITLPQSDKHVHVHYVGRSE